MQLLTLASFIICTIACNLLGAQQQQNIIVWAEDERLSWRDFRGQVDPASDHFAATYSGVQYSFSYFKSGSTELTFHVFAFFDRDQSWAKKDSAGNLILPHEQLHFDIAELHARKFRKALADYSFTRNFEREIKQLYADYNMQRKAMQREYDRDTNHSINREMQAEWEDRVGKALQALQSYQDHEIKVSF